MRALVQQLPVHLQHRIRLEVVKAMGIDGRVLFCIRPGAVPLPDLDIARPLVVWSPISTQRWLLAGPYLVKWCKSQRLPDAVFVGQRIQVFSHDVLLWQQTCPCPNGWLLQGEGLSGGHA